MSGLGNKEIFAKNLQRYIEHSGKDRRVLADEWGFPYSTVSEWLNARKYPRIDRIEIMADYFGILKSDLIEDKSEKEFEEYKKNDAITDIVLRLRKDDDFLKLVESLNKLDNNQLSSVVQLLVAFTK